jgi:hypothetical protein
MLSLVVFCSYYAFGQSKLVFVKKKFREAAYTQGDRISFRIKGERIKFNDIIRGFEDTAIVFKDYKINPSRITHLYLDKKTKNWYFLKYKWDKLCVFAGAGYLILDVLNTGEIYGETVLISGALISTGILANALFGKRIRIKGKRMLRIV